MKNTKIIVSDGDLRKSEDPMKVLFVDEECNLPQALDKKQKKDIESIIEFENFKGKPAKALSFYASTKENKIKIVLVGIGDIKKSSVNEIKDNLRRAGGQVAAIARNSSIAEMTIVLPNFMKTIARYGAEQIVEGVLLGDYQFKKYKKEQDDEKKYSGIESITLYVEKNTSGVRQVVKRAADVCESANIAKDMANEPGNEWIPDSFADFARKLAKKSSLKCTIFGKEQIQKEGMGGIIAVNRGSAVPPRLVVLEHVPAKYSKTIMLVGKGLTFDSGGISLKPSAGMQDMKYDMCGGAAVISAMRTVAAEKPGVRVIALVPATENLSGDKALKPGDIITHYNGVTSEIINTDAEGRLILADALAYGVKTYEPDCVIDLATLTGAVVIALGHHRTGLVSNNDKLADLISMAGDSCGEPVWRLPLDKEYEQQIDSEVADIKNIGGKEGGSITAAAYLKRFVGETPWVHLDIAGTAWDFTKKEYISKGPSGIGVRTLVEFIRNWKSIKL